MPEAASRRKTIVPRASRRLLVVAALVALPTFAKHGTGPAARVSEPCGADDCRCRGGRLPGPAGSRLDPRGLRGPRRGRAPGDRGLRGHRPAGGPGDVRGAHSLDSASPRACGHEPRAAARGSELPHRGGRHPPLGEGCRRGPIRDRALPGRVPPRGGPRRNPHHPHRLGLDGHPHGGPGGSPGLRVSAPEPVPGRRAAAHDRVRGAAHRRVQRHLDTRAGRRALLAAEAMLRGSQGLHGGRAGGRRGPALAGTGSSAGRRSPPSRRPSRGSAAAAGARPCCS